VEQTFTENAHRTRPMFTAPRFRLVQADGATVLRAQPETGGRKILHVSRAEENGGSGRGAGLGVRRHYDIARNEV